MPGTYIRMDSSIQHVSYGIYSNCRMMMLSRMENEYGQNEK